MRRKVTIVADFEKLGALGGSATAANRTPEERAEAARKAIQSRWAAYYAAHPEKLKAKLEKQRKPKAKK